MQAQLFNQQFRKFVPLLQPFIHKGQCGKIGMVGGCLEYTGAPFYSAFSALRAGADLAHIFCTKEAAIPIKSYSPEIIVHPVLPTSSENVSDCFDFFKNILPRLSTLVIGPGLGRHPVTQSAVRALIEQAKHVNMPLVLDGDGIQLVVENSGVLKGHERVVLTPNVNELSRLLKSVLDADYPPTSLALDPTANIPLVKALAARLGAVVVHKGAVDVITDGTEVVICSEEGSPRRCGGQGDILSGVMGLFFSWVQAPATGNNSGPTPSVPPVLLAAHTACSLTRRCSRLAFAAKKRGMVCSDMLAYVAEAFEALHPFEETSACL
eukprot:GCRY01004127.1.p1 GENE.GCRY01004127.1~~GCRY01004127.1.p1  ORF type:complete len:323 (+),score=51.53 GCRY01004127.1:135-1103(+)